LDIAQGELAERLIDAFIERRHDRRVAEEGERPEEAAWAESERRHAERRHEANRAAWAAFHEDQAARHRRTLQDLISHHEARAARLQATDERKPA
jgi:hypothetical protein